MAFIIRLKQGTQKIDLTSGRYSVSPFTPPDGAGGEYTAPVNVNGSTRAEVDQGIDDLNAFLANAGNPELPPMYFEWKPDTDANYSLVWGQRGGPRRVKVLSGDATKPGEYSHKLPTLFVPDIILKLDRAAGVEGSRQLWASAKGGVQEDWPGLTDGRSRGVIVPTADATNGNYFTNPIFMNATYDTGWTAGAGAAVTKNTDPEYLLFGLASARIASTSDTTGTFTCSINVGDTAAHVLSCYARRKDGGTLSATVCQLYYNGAAATTTFTAAGNGWYRLSAAITGVASAVTAGILVKNGYVLYADGFQLEKRAFLTPLMCGDFLGHAWASTAHASKTTRATAYLRLPVAGLLDSYTGTIRVAWKAPMAKASYAANAFILQSSAVANFHLYLDSGTGNWSFMNTAETAAAFSAGDTLIIHVVIDTGSYSLYVNGSLVGTVDSNYLDPTSGYIYVGSDATPANHAGGTFSGLTIFSGAMTAAEVAADNTNCATLPADSQPVDPIPWWWTKDGDDVVDNVDDGSTNENWGLVGGVQGDLPALVEARMAVTGMNDADLYLSLLDIPYAHYIDPEFLTYLGSPDAATVDTSDTTLASLGIDDDEFRILAGRKIAVMVRADEDGSNNVSWRLGVNPGGAYYYTAYLASTWIAASADTSIDLTPDLFVMEDEEIYRILGITRAATVQVQGKRPTGSAVFNLNSAQILPFPITRFTNLSAAGAAPSILYIGGSQKAKEVNSSGALQYPYAVDGELVLIPHRYNVLISYLGREGVLSEVGDTLTYTGYLTPRWRVS